MPPNIAHLSKKSNHNKPDIMDNFELNIAHLSKKSNHNTSTTRMLLGSNIAHLSKMSNQNRWRHSTPFSRELQVPEQPPRT